LAVKAVASDDGACSLVISRKERTLGTDDARAKLHAHVAACVVRHETADIELASGRMSDFYFDGRVATLTGESAVLLAELVLAEVERLGATAVGGPTIGADPIVGATIALAALRGKNLKGFLVRKEPKGRGMGKQVEGPPLEGERALIVEDTVTSGGTIVRAAEAVRREWPGCEIVGAVTLVDREEGGGAALKEAGLPLTAIFSRHDFPAAG
jgi:orotate phosphoribosyltransferase